MRGIQLITYLSIISALFITFQSSVIIISRKSNNLRTTGPHSHFFWHSICCRGGIFRIGTMVASLLKLSSGFGRLLMIAEISHLSPIQTENNQENTY